jgi:UDP-N-acetylmuramoyl-tripeptide--D-alanyl-D-alanine ligase
MKSVLQNLLAFLARKVIQKYKPLIIGITGSVGKTSTRDAVFAVVSQRYRAYKAKKSFNNEIGFPLTILKADAPGRNPVAWLTILIKALGLLLLRQRYPELLVLEYGVDHPGDMDHLLSIAKPHISIITSIGISHYEYFQTPEAIEYEKGKLASALGTNDYLILNADNPTAVRQQSKTKATVISYGTAKDSSIRLVDSQEHFDTDYQTTATIETNQGTLEVTLHALGMTHMAASLASVAVAQALQIDSEAIKRGLAEYHPVPGRLNIIPGIKRSIIIDDSYNAAPDSMKEALALLKRFPGPHKMAVLGDMRELGSMTDQAHEEIGTLAGQLGLDHLFTVGPNGRIMAEAAKAAGMNADTILSFDSADEAKKVVQEILKPETVVLIKGSQNTIRLEKVTKEIMAEPMRANELLCRQEEAWLSHP